ncbi:sulfurtransferase TusA family protein [SAR202 cluster bacterium AC-647-N09_OGT_505m]|nr:sulfurtransferase TusA family protein [SAR202 cluster bacterium AC-647-N09_OGT_505m]
MPDKPELLTLDVRGEVCPGPLVKAMEAMKSALAEQEIEMLTDFFPAVLVVTNAALKQGWDINIQNIASNEWRMLLTWNGETALSG